MRLFITVFLLYLTVVFCACFDFAQVFTPEKYNLVLPAHFGKPVQKGSDSLQQGIITLGRFLFYDKRLSGDNTVACASCHVQANAFSDPKRFSKGVNGFTARNSMSLTNLLWQKHFFWDTRSLTLEAQALIPIENPLEMNQNLDSLRKELADITLYKKLFTKAYGDAVVTNERIATAIAQFEKTIISCDSKYDRYLKGDLSALNEEEQKGLQLFKTVPDPRNNKRGAGCVLCHSSNIMNEHNIRNNGLDSLFADKGVGGINEGAVDIGKFKVPSLRNVSLTAPYMHDGRFNTLEAVLQHYNKNIKVTSTVASFLPSMSNDINGKHLNLTPEEIKCLIAFLNSLSDESVVRNKAFSNPF